MFCMRCGNAVPDDASFCPVCGEKMERYIFKEQELTNEYQYIFLCGSHYINSDQKDKRNVLRNFLKKKNAFYRPIILEDNFIFKKNKSRFLQYDDIYMKDLYQVEMVMNGLPNLPKCQLTSVYFLCRFLRKRLPFGLLVTAYAGTSGKP